MTDDELDRAVATLTDASPSPALHAKVMTRLAKTAAPLLPAWRLPLAAAAVVVVAAAIWIAYRPAAPRADRPVVQQHGHDLTLPSDHGLPKPRPEPVPPGIGHGPDRHAASTRAGMRPPPRMTGGARASGVESTEGETTGTEPIEEPSPIPPIAVPPIELVSPAATMTPVTLSPIEIQRIEVPLLDDRGDSDRPPSPGEKAQSSKPKA